MLGKHVTLKEVKDALKLFKKEKSPCPNGWAVKLSLHFFYLMGEDLLTMVEFSRIEGFVSGAINSTFITLVPKCNQPETFTYFRPISLCNLIYKLI